MASERKPFLTWLIVITAVGAALRVFRLNEIPYTYDELSALSRTHFNSFHDLIQKGVAGDGHPAGVQVFLYYWVKIAGDAEWVVKLPFIIMGILCIPLIYQIGKKWFGRSEAIIAACFMAGLQYTVMYSQIARPYISGLFLILLLVAIWNVVMAKATIRNLLAFAIVLALCAYNHYFSLLTAAGIAATGLFVIDRKYLLKYILAILLSVALCLPHLHVFLQQLQLKGLEWVPAPTPGFFKNYLYYVFNFSDYILAALVLLLAQGVYFYAKTKPPLKLKYRFIALLWFTIPAAVGYFYSVYRAPVLETSVLIFGFPFLLLFICSFVRLPFSYFRDIEIGLLLLILVVSLGWERSYYKLFYQAQVEMFARHISGYEMALAKGQVAAVVNTNPNYLDFYKKKYPTSWNYQIFDSIQDNMAWRRWLEKCDADYLVLCNPPVEWGKDYLPIAQEYFKCVDSVYYGFTTDIYILKKTEVKCKPIPHPVWVTEAEQLTPEEFKHCYVEGALRTDNIKEMMKICLSVSVFVDSIVPDGRLAIKFHGRNISEQRRESLFRNSIDNKKGWHKVYLTARCYHVPINNTSDFYYELDPGGDCDFRHFRDFKVEVVPDNPILYSFIKK